MTSKGGLVRGVEPHGLLSLSDQLVAYQSHHHSLFLDQSVSDALGGEGLAVRRQAAFEASHALLASFYAELGITEAPDRLDLASQLFAAMGQGRLTFELTAEGGRARGYELHFGEGFSEKYGGVVRNRRPIDTFAAGFVSAAASLAYPSDWGTLEAEETACVAQGDDTSRPSRRPALGRPPDDGSGTRHIPQHGPEECAFTLTRRPERPRFGAIVTRPLVENLPLAVPDDGAGVGMGAGAGAGPEASSSAADLAQILDYTAADDDGVMVAFGVRLALVPVSYTNQIMYDTVHLIEKRAPELFPLVAALVRESAQIGAFHLLGGVLASPAWQAAHGPPARDIEVRLQQLVGLLPAFGWGSFCAGDFIPGHSLVLRSAMTHESAYYAVRHGSTVRSRLFFQQGVALAIMQLLHRVDFTTEVPLARGSYDALFRSGTRFRVEETCSPLRGDRVCEVAVSVALEG